MRILDVRREDTEPIGALMHDVVTSSLRLESEEMNAVLTNVEANLHWAQANYASAVHLKCVDGSRIVGVVLIKDFWNLCSLFVDPCFQRRGIGRALLLAGIQRCISEDIRRCIKVNAAPNAVPFYQSLGFDILDNAPRKGTSVPMIFHQNG